MMMGLISVSMGRLSAPQGSVFTAFCMPAAKCRLINNNNCKDRCSYDLVPGGLQAALQGLLPHLLLGIAEGSQWCAEPMSFPQDGEMKVHGRQVP